MKYIRKTADEKYLLKLEGSYPKNFSNTPSVIDSLSEKMVIANDFTISLVARAPLNMFRFYGGWLSMNSPPGYPRDSEIIDITGFYAPTKKHIWIAGGGLPVVEHELAHFLEITNLERLKFSDMGMSVNYPARGQPKLSEKEWGGWWTGWLRELRTRQIQRVLEEKPLEMAKTMNDVTNNHHLHFQNHFQTFGRFNSANEVEEYIVGFANKVRQDWTKERVVHEFDKRVTYLQEWMQTKGKS